MKDQFLYVNFPLFVVMHCYEVLCNKIKKIASRNIDRSIRQEIKIYK